jgi:Helix-turn-helix.
LDTVQRTYELLEEKGLSLFELSEKSDVPYTTIKMAERRGSQLKVETIERICEGLGISMSEFFSTASIPTMQ